MSYQEFLGFHALRQLKNTKSGFPNQTALVELDDIFNEVDDASLKEELRSCQFILVDSDFERVRHKVFNYAIENLNATAVDEKLDHLFKNLKCGAKVNLVSEFTRKHR